MTSKSTPEPGDASADLVSSPKGRTLSLRYKDGEKTVQVPEATPVVTFKPRDRSLLAVGGKVVVTAEVRNGQPVATHVLAGRNGFMPPLWPWLGLGAASAAARARPTRASGTGSPH